MTELQNTKHAIVVEVNNNKSVDDHCDDTTTSTTTPKTCATTGTCSCFTRSSSLNSEESLSPLTVTTSATSCNDDHDDDDQSQRPSLGIIHIDTIAFADDDEEERMDPLERALNQVDETKEVKEEEKARRRRRERRRHRRGDSNNEQHETSSSSCRYSRQTSSGSNKSLGSSSISRGSTISTMTLASSMNSTLASSSSMWDDSGKNLDLMNLSGRLSLGAGGVNIDSPESSGIDNNETEAAPTQQQDEEDKSNLTPREVLEVIFGKPTWIEKSSFSWDNYFHTYEPQQQQSSSPESNNAMTEELSRAIESGDPDALRCLWKRGASMNSRNQYGQTVLHLVCQKGSLAQLDFLLSDAKVSARVYDDTMKKSPHHELAWRNPATTSSFGGGSTPLSLALRLLQDSPELLWAPDCRGFLPIEYVPKPALPEWYDFLEDRKAILTQALEFSRWKDSSRELNATQLRLQNILDRHNGVKRRSVVAPAS